MPTIKSYLYSNKISVTLSVDDATLKTRNRVVYSPILILHRGVDNRIFVELLNNDQKPIDTTNRTFTLQVWQDNTEIWNGPVTIVDQEQSRGEVVISSSSMDDFKLRRYEYTVTYTDNNLTVAAYVDDNYGARGEVEVRNGIAA